MLTRDPILSGALQYPAVITSNNTVADTDFKFTDSNLRNVADTTVTCYTGLTSPYTVANYEGRAAKLVAAGIKITYEDKEIDRSGMYICWRNPQPTAQSSATADDLSAYLAYNIATQTRVSDTGSAGITYLPVTDGDLYSYTNPVDPGGLPMESVANRMLGAVFIANGQSGARYTFEAVAHFEIYGQALPTTPSHSDVQAVSIAMGAASNVPPNPSLTVQLSQAVQNAYLRAQENQFGIDLGGLGRLFAQAGATYIKKRLLEEAPRLLYKGGRQLLLR